MANKKTITVWIAGRGYKLRIEPEKEEAIRKATKIAEDKINELRKNVKARDEQDFLALSLLMYVTDQVAEDVSLNITQQGLIEEIMQSIDEILE